MLRSACNFLVLLPLTLTLALTTSSLAQTFAPPVSYSANVGRNLVRADFNNDGHQDLASVAGSNGTILLGSGDGLFSRRDFDAGVPLTDIIGADVNGDSKVDLVGLNVADTSTRATILLGNGDGTFQAPRFFAAGTHPVSIAVADLN